ncbi:MAG: 50S ribosomal protein L11 [Candidatus Micrarchaeota archaeon]|nr:50S ribosomal protein L11 [Candidatus Micrarchaeota archaeon]
MSKITIPAIVEGGRATAGPPLGPALGPLGVNIGGIIEEINKKTAPFAGLKVPVKVVVDKATKKFEVEVGSPSTGELLKKELGVEKGRKGGAEDPKVIGNLTLAQVIKVAKMKAGGSLVKDVKKGANEVLGTCVSLGITVDGKDPRKVIEEIKKGEHDSQFASQ